MWNSHMTTTHVIIMESCLHNSVRLLVTTPEVPPKIGNIKIFLFHDLDNLLHGPAGDVIIFDVFSVFMHDAILSLC